MALSNSIHYPTLSFINLLIRCSLWYLQKVKQKKKWNESRLEVDRNGKSFTREIGRRAPTYGNVLISILLLLRSGEFQSNFTGNCCSIKRLQSSKERHCKFWRVILVRKSKIHYRSDTWNESEIKSLAAINLLAINFCW